VRISSILGQNLSAIRSYILGQREYSKHVDVPCKGKKTTNIDEKYID
jgi:hypothetical protein